MEALSPRSTNLKLQPLKMGNPAGKDPATMKAEVKKPPKEHAPPPPPEVVEPYQDSGCHTTTYLSGKLLGKGGFAVCYEGKSKRSNQVYALKIVKSKMSQQRMADKFRTELQIHAKMHHPNIVNFFRAFSYQESTYVVLELCENGSVMDMVKRRKCLSLPEVRRLTIQLCGAVKYMHQRNVIHRDLKMGNLFLDNHMNIKVGDFGLAAILIDDKEAKKYRKLEKIRRTTMCGTPNYIAPEILEKQKNGHGHKVDIWAIGVICFAMLTGFPPFQSSSQEEIYRKVKTLEYVWPKDFDSSVNFIPKEAKDLVSSCLNLNPEDRPDPDEIVDHNFFKMYLRCIPKALDSSCRVTKPVWLKQQDPRGDTMETTFGMDTEATDNFFASCGVGHNSQGKMLACVGEKVNKTASLECLEEEYSGLNPVVPIAETVIYSPDYRLDSEGNMLPLWGVDQRQPIDENDDSPPLSRTTSMPSIANQAELPLRSLPKIRPAPQSHAATLRQQALSSRPQPPNPIPVEPRTVTTASGSTRRHIVVANDMPLTTQPAIPPRDPTRLLSRPSVRSSSRIASSESLRMGVVQPKPPGLPRSQTSGDVRTERRQRTTTSHSSRRVVVEEIEVLECPIELHREQSKEPKWTTETNLERIIPKTMAPKAIAPVTLAPYTLDAVRQPSFFDPSDAVETIPQTRPDVILAQLKAFLENLKVAAKDLERGTRTRRQKQENPNHLVVTKWVDYTNKFGIGYILNDGTVGCLYKSTTSLPSSSIAIPGGELHHRKKKQDDMPYSERAQIIPQNGPPIEFLETTLNGLQRLQVDVKTFDVDKRVERKVYSNIYYQEKLKRINLWDKFGKYMTTTLGGEDNARLIAEIEKKQNSAASPDHSYVKFYQRCGNVGVWGFGDGAFQFNFPDHTKLIASNEGKWIDFCVLRLQDAVDMAKTSLVTARALEKREVLSMPTAQMKYQYATTLQNSKNILKANDFEEKMWWAQSIMQRWIENGGTGLLGETGKNRPGYVDDGAEKAVDGYWYYKGTRELLPPKGEKLGWTEKLVWVSVGGSTTKDTQYETLVKPA